MSDTPPTENSLVIINNTNSPDHKMVNNAYKNPSLVHKLLAPVEYSAGASPSDLSGMTPTPRIQKVPELLLDKKAARPGGKAALFKPVSRRLRGPVRRSSQLAGSLVEDSSHDFANIEEHISSFCQNKASFHNEEE